MGRVGIRGRRKRVGGTALGRKGDERVGGRRAREITEGGRI